jgi:hypothetical protein
MKIRRNLPSCGIQEAPAMMAGIRKGSAPVSNLLFFRRSCAYRCAAADMMRKARAMPPGPERRAARQLARALKDMANTEAWLEGQTPHLRSATYSRQRRRSAVSASA